MQRNKISTFFITLPNTEETENYEKESITFDDYCAFQDEMAERYTPISPLFFPRLEDIKKHHPERNMPKYAKFFEFLLLTEYEPEQKEARAYINDLLGSYYIFVESKKKKIDSDKAVIL